MPRIAFIGAGSTVFTRNLIGDLLRSQELAGTTTLALMDIDPERLRTSEAAARATAAALGVRPRVQATRDRRAALDGADYVVTSFQVGGYRPATVVDFEVPKRFGLRQTIADTLGVGGVMRGLRTIPVLLDVCRDMEDLYPALRKVTPPAGNRVRYEVLRHLGYFVTESSVHFAEYVSWFIKASRPDLLERFNIPLDEYPRRCEAQIAEWETPRARLIDNLPADCCVEVPCVASDRGIEPQAVGALPRHLAALMQTNVNVQGLTVEAALSGERAAVHHAAMLDPHTAGELALDEIAELVDALIEAHGDLMPALR